jgi:hypothetical protein
MTTIYPGTTRSAINRIRRVLTRAGYPLGTYGRYQVFAPAIGAKEGWKASRLGCSATVTLSYCSAGNKSGRDVEKATLPQVIATLRAVGLPVDDKGWMACKYE